MRPTGLVPHILALYLIWLSHLLAHWHAVKLLQELDFQQKINTGAYTHEHIWEINTGSFVATVLEDKLNKQLIMNNQAH